MNGRGALRALLISFTCFLLFQLSFQNSALADSAYRVSGETRTVLESYDGPTGNAALPVYQYILLRMNKGTGNNSEKVRLYGRLAGDINGEVDADSRIYYAYYEKKGFWRDTDIRLGRQWINSVAGSPILDGFQVSKRKAGSIKFSLFGGGFVTLEDDDSNDYVWGFSVGEQVLENTDLSLSYMQKRAGGDLAREYLGLSGVTRVARKGSAYAEAQYDMLSEIFGYYLAGVRLSPNRRWTVKAEYSGSNPVFDSISIYSVFSVDEYRELSLSADYRLDRNWTIFSNYRKEYYTSFEDADVIEAGFDLFRPAGVGGYLVAVLRNGDEDLSGIKGNVRISKFHGIRLDLGAEIDVYNRTDDDLDDTTAKRFWAAGERKIAEDLDLSVKVERVESMRYDYYNRGRVSLRYVF